LIKSASRSKSIARPLTWSPAGRAIMSECPSVVVCACVRACVRECAYIQSESESMAVWSDAPRHSMQECLCVCKSLCLVDGMQDHVPSRHIL
jgi:hypothetical protein